MSRHVSTAVRVSGCPTCGAATGESCHAVAPRVVGGAFNHVHAARRPRTPVRRQLGTLPTIDLRPTRKFHLRSLESGAECIIVVGEPVRP